MYPLFRVENYIVFIILLYSTLPHIFKFETVFLSDIKAKDRRILSVLVNCYFIFSSKLCVEI